MLDTNGSTQLPHGIQPPAYRLPNTAHVGAVHLLVSDLPRSLEHYELVIGPSPLAIEQERAVLGCKAGRVLAVLHTRTGVTPARRGASFFRTGRRSGDLRHTSHHSVFALEWRIT